VAEGPEGPARTVVCVHGIGASWLTFEPLIPFLCSRGLRVLAFDLYGFGKSVAASGRRLDRDLYIDQLLGLMDEVLMPEERKVCLLGFSMGGVLAAEFARRHPERVGKLLLIAPGGFLKKELTPCGPFIFKGLRGRLGGLLVSLAGCLVGCCEALTCGRLKRRLASSPSVRDFFTPDVREPANFEHRITVNVANFTGNLRRSITSYLTALRRMPLWEEDFAKEYDQLAAGPVPILFMWGLDDNTIPWEEVQVRVTKTFSRRKASCIRIPAAGHGMMMEDTEQVANCVGAWFTDSADPAWHHCLQQFQLIGEPTSVNEPRLGDQHA